MFIDALFSLNRSFFAFWGYFLVFAALFIESLPFIGAVLPGGTIVLLIAGLFSRWGFFELWKVLVVAISAAITIDIFGYCTGRYLKRFSFYRFLRNKFVNQETLDRIGRVAHGHTGKVLVFGRLNPVTRSMAPFIVGSERVNFWKFLLFNIIGAVLWVSLFISVGYIFGMSFHGIEGMERFVIWTTLAIVSGFYGYYVVCAVLSGRKKRNGKKK